MASAIHVRGLRKSYGDVEAVRGIDLEVAAGEVFALLGPNGAGKTTTLEILEGHRGRDAGDVRVLGHDPALGHRELRRRTGIVLQETGTEPYLTVEETVRLFRGYYPDPLRVDDVLGMAGLLDQRARRVNRLSGGQRRRLDVAIALAGNPELLFLDEPTTGFDPAARRGAWSMIRGLRARGRTVVLTTHYLDEAEALADRVALLVAGRMVAEGAPGALAGASETTISFRLPAEGLPGPAIGARVVDGRVILRTDRPTHTVHALTAWAMERGVELEGLTVSRPTLEEMYLKLAGEEER